MPDEEHREPFRVTADSADPAYDSPVVEKSELSFSAGTARSATCAAAAAAPTR